MAAPIHPHRGQLLQVIHGGGRQPLQLLRAYTQSVTVPGGAGSGCGVGEPAVPTACTATVRGRQWRLNRGHYATGALGTLGGHATRTKYQRRGRRAESVTPHHLAESHKARKGAGGEGQPCGLLVHGTDAGNPSCAGSSGFISCLFVVPVYDCVERKSIVEVTSLLLLGKMRPTSKVLDSDRSAAATSANVSIVNT